jgi:putative membrane protein
MDEVRMKTKQQVKKEYFIAKLMIYIKGVAMGAADIIPGVSGGSIAFITGIYDQLIDAIHSVNGEVLKDIATGKIIQGIKKIHWGFILPLLAGILTSLFTMAGLMHFLLEDYQVYTWSFFFGLILASSYVISKEFKLSASNLLFVLIGGGLAFFIVGLVPVSTPDDLWFIFLCGAIAICAMILPGISGAFLLLVLGKYHYITGLLKAPFEGTNLIVISVFSLGCLVGIMSFARLLKWVLAKYHYRTMAFLTGMMLGSLRKIWPYKEVIEKKLIEDKEIIMSERLIAPWNVQENMVVSFIFIALGIGVIVLLDYVVLKHEAKKESSILEKNGITKKKAGKLEKQVLWVYNKGVKSLKCSIISLF